MKNILVLYSEVMGYNLGCFRELVARGYHVHCVRWDDNKKTPYEPESETGITFYLRSIYNTEKILTLAQELKPLLIFTSGWMDKVYLPVCKKYKKSIPVIAGLDNWWKGTLKQHLAAILSFHFVKPYFSNLFVPGKHQYLFARKMGYSDSKILKGLLTCDTLLFQGKPNLNAHKLLYVGRYSLIKGLIPLVKAFNEISQKIPNWQLHLYGSGELKDELKSHANSQVYIHDFVAPEEVKNLYQSSSVFCLPSLHEPWGLVIHEATCTGLPLLVSKNIGACTTFFEEGKNGYSFDPNSKEEIEQALLKICNATESQMQEFSEKSAELSLKVSVSKWADSLLGVL